MDPSDTCSFRGGGCVSKFIDIGEPARVDPAKPRLFRDAPNEPNYIPDSWPRPPEYSAATKAWEAKEQARLLANREAALAESERLRIEREAEEQRKAAEWEANRPQREAAQREIALLELQLAELDSQGAPLLARMRSLREVAER
jgi:hypothetical protein